MGLIYDPSAVLVGYTHCLRPRYAKQSMCFSMVRVFVSQSVYRCVCLSVCAKLKNH